MGGPCSFAPCVPQHDAAPRAFASHCHSARAAADGKTGGGGGGETLDLDAQRTVRTREQMAEEAATLRALFD